MSPDKTDPADVEFISNVAPVESIIADPQSSLGPLTDSPFFWLIVFGLSALIGGMVIAPKYSKRMDRVERMYDARLKAYVERVGGDTSQMPVSMHREVSIRELLIFVAVILLGGGVVGRWWEVRGRKASTTTDEP